VQHAPVASNGIGGCAGAVAARDEAGDLALDRRRRQSKLVPPPVRDRVVAEDERTVGRYGVRSSCRGAWGVGVSGGRTVLYSL
jgi:hypothetical protein